MSARIAILCSGQGGQGRTMFDWLADAAEAAPVFAAAAASLGADPRRFVKDADEQALFGNRTGQILCVTQALAAWSVLEPVLIDRPPGSVVLAGYSVGELAAWGCAGLVSAERTLVLAAERARLMDEAAPPDAGLAAIVGLDHTKLAFLLDRHGLALAIDNGDSGVVVGGAADALRACLEEARTLGARRTVRLRVSVPSHTALLQAAADGFDAVLEREPMQTPHKAVRLLSGLDGETVRHPRAGSRKLAAQIAMTVRWDACLRSCQELGAATVLELGPGAAMAAMADAAFGSPVARSINQFRGADGVRQWVSRPGRTGSSA